MGALEEETGVSGEVGVAITADDLTDPEVIAWMKDYRQRVLDAGGYEDDCRAERHEGLSRDLPARPVRRRAARPRADPGRPLAAPSVLRAGGHRNRSRDGRDGQYSVAVVRNQGHALRRAEGARRRDAGPRRLAGCRAAARGRRGVRRAARGLRGKRARPRGPCGGRQRVTGVESVSPHLRGARGRRARPLPGRVRPSGAAASQVRRGRIRPRGRQGRAARARAADPGRPGAWAGPPSSWRAPSSTSTRCPRRSARW